MRNLILLLALSLFAASTCNASLLDGLISHYNLPEDGNNTRLDVHGSNDLGTFSGAGVSNSSGGVQGYCQNFAAGDYLETASSTPFVFGDTSFTIAAWVNADIMGGSSQRMIIDKANSNTGREFRIDWVPSPNRFRFMTFDLNDTVVITETTQTLSAGVWYLIIAEHDAVNNTTSIRVNNGTLNSTELIGGLQSTFTNSKFTIGSKSGMTGGLNYVKWDGKVDHVSVWSRVLTEADHTLLYNAGTGLAYTTYGSAGSGGEPPPPPSGSIDLGDLHLEYDDAVELDVDTLNGAIESLSEAEAVLLRDFITDWINL